MNIAFTFNPAGDYQDIKDLTLPRRERLTPIKVPKPRLDTWTLHVTFNPVHAYYQYKIYRAEKGLTPRYQEPDLYMNKLHVTFNPPRDYTKTNVCNSSTQRKGYFQGTKNPRICTWTLHVTFNPAGDYPRQKLSLYHAEEGLTPRYQEIDMYMNIARYIQPCLHVTTKTKAFTPARREMVNFQVPSDRSTCTWTLHVTPMSSS